MANRAQTRMHRQAGGVQPRPPSGPARSGLPSATPGPGRHEGSGHESRPDPLLCRRSTAWSPRPYRELFRATLARLQDDVPPLASDEIAAVIQAELGAPPEEIFAFFSPRPVAAASIGQVHLARLADGTELAVKVQYPGVADAVRADLANTDLLASVIRAGLALLGPQAPRLDPKMMVEEIRDRVGDELDYRIEAANQQEFHTLYDGHPFIHIPAVYPEFSTSRVLATDYVHGRRWSEATAAARRHPLALGRDDLPFRVHQPAPTRALQRRPASRELPLPRRRHRHLPRLRLRQEVRPPSASRSCPLWWTPPWPASAPACSRPSSTWGCSRATTPKALDPDRLLEFYRAALRDRWDAQPFTYTPESVAEIVAGTYQPSGP